MSGRLVRVARQAGMTLIELIVAVAVVATAVTAILGVYAAVAVRSADALVRQQAVAVAESYLEEVTLKAFADPDGTEAEAGRAEWDDVDDYDGLVDEGVRDQSGAALEALAGYRVSVAVVATNALDGVPAALARRIDVTVEGPGGVRVALSGMRAGF